MAPDANAVLFEAVVRFVAEEVGVPPEKIEADIRIREDLYMDRDDACDLLIAFSKRFHVRDQNFVFADHFGPEASWFPCSLLFSRRKLLPMTIQDLVDSATGGVWHVSSKDKLIASC